MPRVPLNKEVNTFVKGLITEANPLAFPEDASLVDENFLLETNGLRKRRFGLGFESGTSPIETGFTDAASAGWAINTYRWENVSNDGTLAILVVQMGKYLYFFDLYRSPIMSYPLNTGSGNPDNRMQISKADPTIRMSFSSVAGKLVMVCGAQETFVLEYDNDTDVVTSTARQIKTRDLFGVEDGLGITETPATLSGEHEYNLKNQGWTDARISDYFSSQGVYPSNAQIWTFGKDATDNDAFDPSLLDRQNFGSGQAPIGKSIIKAFSRGTSRGNNTSIVGLPTDESEAGPLACADYAGRIFYAGSGPEVVDGDDRSPILSSYVFYTQLVKEKNQIYNCYQDADPSSEHISDLVATDGGFLVLTGANRVLDMHEVGKSLVVLAENGIWEISGSDGTGFSATNLAVTKVANINIDSRDAAVVAENLMFVWAKEGIYILQPDKVSGRLSAQSLTENTIQSLYTGISAAGRRNAKGIYDGISREVRWLYNDEDGYDGINYRQGYNKELTFKLTLGAFVLNTFDTSSFTQNKRVAGYITTGSRVSQTVTENLYANGVQVTASGVPVTVTFEGFERTESSLKYLTTYDSEDDGSFNFQFAEFNNNLFEDFGEVDAPAVLVTGYDAFTAEPKDSQRNKKVEHITFHFNRTETGFTEDGNGDMQYTNPSSCLVQGRWNWANSSGGGGYTDEQQVYKYNRNYTPDNTGDFDWGYSILSYQTIIPGSGKVLSMRIKSEPQKDLQLYGWGITASSNSKPSPK